MPRQATARIKQIEAQLRLRLNAGFLLPGETFFSARQLAAQFKVSYQTAHRILSRLENEGLVTRQVGAPTRVAGMSPAYRSVALLFASRAQRKSSFGHRLHALLSNTLDLAGITATTQFRDAIHAFPVEAYPVVWEASLEPEALASLSGHCLFLNAKPVLGLMSRLVDSITVDDFSGGLAAGELLSRLYACQRVAIIAGPKTDDRSRQRVAGFLTEHPNAAVIYAETWGPLAEESCFDEVLASEPDGVFCANDRLASQFKDYCQRRQWPVPVIIGFDDAPVAQKSRITTIAIPWEQLVTASVEIIKKRLDGNREAGQHRMLTCSEVIRC